MPAEHQRRLAGDAERVHGAPRRRSALARRSDHDSAKGLVALALARCRLRRSIGHHSFAIYSTPRIHASSRASFEEFRWINPHSWVFLEVVAETAARRSGRSSTGRSTCCRARVGRADLEAGDRVRIEVHPAHTGRPVGRFIDFEFAERATAAAAPSDYTRGTITRVPRPRAGADDGRGGPQLQRHLGQRERRHPFRYRGRRATSSSRR